MDFWQDSDQISPQDQSGESSPLHFRDDYQPTHCSLITTGMVSTNQSDHSVQREEETLLHIESQPDFVTQPRLHTREGNAHISLFQETDLNDLGRVQQQHSDLFKLLASLSEEQCHLRHQYVTCTCRGHRSSCVHHVAEQQMCLSCSTNVKYKISLFGCTLTQCREQ